MDVPRIDITKTGGANPSFEAHNQVMFASPPKAMEHIVTLWNKDDVAFSKGRK